MTRINPVHHADVVVVVVVMVVVVWGVGGGSSGYLNINLPNRNFAFKFKS